MYHRLSCLHTPPHTTLTAGLAPTTARIQLITLVSLLIYCSDNSMSSANIRSDALENAEILLDLNGEDEELDEDDEDLDDDDEEDEDEDDDYEDGEEFDDLDDEDDDEDDHVVLNLNAEQAQRLIALAAQEVGDEDGEDGEDGEERVEILAPGQTRAGLPQARMMGNSPSIVLP